METGRPLFIPVILGTARMGRMSLHAAQLVTGNWASAQALKPTLSISPSFPCQQTMRARPLSKPTSPPR